MLSLFGKIIKNKSINKGTKICDFVRGGLIFGQNGQVKVCAKSSCDEKSEFSLLDNFDGLWLDTNNIKNKINNIKSHFVQDYVPENCTNCCYLVNNNNIENVAFDFIVLAHWQCCFLNCSYCNGKKTDDLSVIKHFDIMPVIQQLIDEKLVTKETKIIFECGDATLHPEFDKLMYFFINYEMRNIEIHTSAQRYCHSVAEAIGKNIVKVIVSLDGGCPYIYERIKGVNKYDLTVSNLKRYLEFEEKNKKQVIINYILLERINDNKKEILDWFMFSRNLGVKKLSIDIDEKWYNNIEHLIPDYLKEIIIFTKELSEFNNLEIEFLPKMKALYNRINRES